MQPIFCDDSALSTRLLRLPAQQYFAAIVNPKDQGLLKMDSSPSKSLHTKLKSNANGYRFFRVLVCSTLSSLITKFCHLYCLKKLVERVNW